MECRKIMLKMNAKNGEIGRQAFTRKSEKVGAMRFILLRSTEMFHNRIA